MSNSYFQFKQFKVEQGNCAMKVTTDACIAGAWTPIAAGVKKVLDIGTGTGLLALMLAQRNADITIDAIELDTDAAEQAIANITASPWADRINIFEGDVRNYSFDGKYDLIITNPPFFNNSLLSGTDNKNLARHTLSLSYSDLFDVIDRVLSDEGTVSVLLPVNEFKIWADLTNGREWRCVEQLQVRHTPDADVKRVVGLFKRKADIPVNQQFLAINAAPGKYSDDFVVLLSEFYLNL